MSTVHRNLTGADLHEPKGADTALSGSVYVANGSGSGVWTDASTIITNTAFTTGDAKLTLKATADTGWVLMDDGTIGDGSSSATTRANADTQSLYYLLWNNVSNTYAPVSGGRGVSAAADFAAHKAIALTKQLGRALGIAGAGSGLTTRSLGENTGAETTVLTASQIPSITSTVSVSGTLTGATASINEPQSNSTTGGGAFTISGQYSTLAKNVTVSGTLTGTATSNNTSGQAHTNMQPTAFWNVMIKL